MSFFAYLFNTKSATQKPVETIKTATSGTCPYCATEITPLPSRKKKCPQCGEFIIVRTHYKTKERIFLTELQASKFDIEREKYYGVTSFLRGLGLFGIEKSEIDRFVIEQTKTLTERFGKEPAFADVAWGVSNRLIMEHPDLASGIHFQQALFLHSEGKDPTKIRLLGFERDLKEYQKSDVVIGVEVLTAGEQSCEQCRKLENKVFTIEEALKDKILPCKECSFNENANGHGWCRCCYAPKV